MKLAGKVAVITGAGSGMGRASAVLFAKEGAGIVAADMNEAGARETVEMIRNNGGRAVAVKCNVTVEEEVKAVMDAAVANFGKIDIMFAVAGCPQSSKPIEETEAAEIQRILDVNVKGPLLCAKHSARELRKTGDGVLMIVGSGAALRPRGGVSAYAASKSAVQGMGRCLANELAPEVRVAVINPGGVDTPMMKQFIPGYTDKDKEGVFGGTPLGKVITPEDIAELALFIATADKITGVEYNIDCGLQVSRGKY